MYLYQSMSMDVTYNSRQPKSLTLTGISFALMTTFVMKKATQRSKTNSW
jgi:hypothetical protein